VITKQKPKASKFSRSWNCTKSSKSDRWWSSASVIHWFAGFRSQK